MKNYGSLMKVDLALTARLGTDGLKLESELQLKSNWDTKTFIYIPPPVPKLVKNSLCFYQRLTLIV